TTKEAHAWPEIHISGMGWVAFEPTPGRFEPNPTNYTGTYNPSANPVLATTTTTASASDPAAPTPTTARAQKAEEDPFEPDSTSSGSGFLKWLAQVGAALVAVAVVLAVPPILK